MVAVEVKGKIEDGKSYILEIEKGTPPFEVEEIRDQIREAFPKNKFIIMVGGMNCHDKDEFVKAIKQAGIV